LSKGQRILNNVLGFLPGNPIATLASTKTSETTEITAVYVEYQKGSVDPGAWRLIFENENGTYKIISPIITKIHVKLEVGKTYKIEYFDNSKIIKKYTLIE
jgi:hypothetical protein